MSDLPPFLTLRADGAVVLTGQRIGLYHVVIHYNEGFSPEMLIEQFPSLSLSLIHKVVAYYLDNRSAVDSYCADITKTLDDQQVIGRHVNVIQLRERLARREKAKVATGT